MADEYTPTTDQVRDAALLGAFTAARDMGQVLDQEEFLAQFDRWLAEHDAEIVARCWAMVRDVVMNTEVDYLATQVMAERLVTEITTAFKELE